MRHPKTNNFTKLRSAVEHYLRDIHKRRRRWIGVLEVKNWMKFIDGYGVRAANKRETGLRIRT